MWRGHPLIFQVRFRWIGQDAGVKIGVSEFQQRFSELARQRLRERPEASTAEPADSVAPGRVTETAAGDPHAVTSFAQLTLALAASAPAGGVAVLALVAQDAARSLVTSEQEASLARGIRDSFASRIVPSPPQLQQSWQKVSALSASLFAAPEVVNSVLVEAQADSGNLFLGQATLAHELADPDVLAFAVAHEEGHRQHRDTTGSRGLELLLQACGDDPQLFPLAFRACHEGRRGMERAADAFAARVTSAMGCHLAPIAAYLASLPGDSEHPDGAERAAAVTAEFRRA